LRQIERKPVTPGERAHGSVLGGDEFTVLLDDLSVVEVVAKRFYAAAGVRIPLVDGRCQAAIDPESVSAPYAGESCSHDYNARLARGVRDDWTQDAGCSCRRKQRAGALEKLTAGDILPPGALATRRCNLIDRHAGSVGFGTSRLSLAQHSRQAGVG
jgi:hypothetical protein